VSETSPLNVGTKAPDFTAMASDGTTYRLSDLLARGHVALFFYPGNNTPG
jgi:peroxiredoxin